MNPLSEENNYKVGEGVGLISACHPECLEDEVYDEVTIELDTVVLVNDDLNMLIEMIKKAFDDGYGLTKRGVSVVLKEWSPDHDDFLLMPENEKWLEAYESGIPLFACYMLKRPTIGLVIDK